MNELKENAYATLRGQLETILTMKAKHDFEQERTFYPPRNGREEWTWHNENTGEHYTQEEAWTHIESAKADLLEKIIPELTKAAMDNLHLD